VTPTLTQQPMTVSVPPPVTISVLPSSFSSSLSPPTTFTVPSSSLPIIPPTVLVTPPTRQNSLSAYNAERAADAAAGEDAIVEEEEERNADERKEAEPQMLEEEAEQDASNEEEAEPELEMEQGEQAGEEVEERKRERMDALPVVRPWSAPTSSSAAVVATSPSSSVEARCCDGKRTGGAHSFTCPVHREEMRLSAQQTAKQFSRASTAAKAETPTQKKTDLAPPLAKFPIPLITGCYANEEQDSLFNNFMVDAGKLSNGHVILQPVLVLVSTAQLEL